MKSIYLIFILFKQLEILDLESKLREDGTVREEEGGGLGREGREWRVG